MLVLRLILVLVLVALTFVEKLIPVRVLMIHLFFVGRLILELLALELVSPILELFSVVGLVLLLVLQWRLV